MTSNFKFQISNSDKNNGFTLIELIVVMSVFLFVIGAAILIFISIIQHQRKILAEQELLNQISYAQEYMSKALRMAKTDTDGSCLDGNVGYVYLLTNPDQNSGFYRGIKFINQSDGDTCQEFILGHADLNDESSPLVLKELKGADAINNNESNAVPLTSKNLQIDSVRFGINGADGCYGTGGDCPDGASESDTLQPRVTILLGIKIQGDSQDRVIQTTVSRRNLNKK